jgi:hypothetical protein
MVVGDKKFGVVYSYVLVGGSGGILPQKIIFIFPPLELKFLDNTLQRYIVLL